MIKSMNMEFSIFYVDKLWDKWLACANRLTAREAIKIGERHLGVHGDHDSKCTHIVPPVII